MTAARNPSNPTLVGEEWRPANANPGPNYRIASTSDAVVQTLTPTGAATKATIAPFVKMDTVGGEFVFETMLAGQEVQAITTTIVRPNHAVNIGSDTSPTTDSAIATILAQATIDPTQFVYAGTGSHQSIATGLHFPLTGLFTGRRILDVRLVVTASDPASSPLVIFELSLLWWDPGFGGGGLLVVDLYNPNTPPGLGPTVAQAFGSTGEMSHQRVASFMPATFWNVTLLESFDGSSTAANQFRVVLGANSTNTARLYQAWLEVDHCPENRLTVDLVKPQSAAGGWAAFSPTHPDGTTSGFAKPAVPFTTILRQGRYGTIGRPSNVAADYTLFVPYLQGATTDTDFGVTQYPDVAMNASGVPGDLETPVLNRMCGVDLRDGSGHTDVDSTTYVYAVPAPLPVGAGTPVQQEMSNTASDDYAGAIVPVLYTAPPVGQTATMTVELRRRSDDHLMASGTITGPVLVANFPDLGGGWRTAQVPFAAPVTLVAGTQYYLGLKQSSVTSGGFSAGLMESNSGGHEAQPTGVATYRGTTDIATFLGIDTSTGDFAATIYLAIDPPAAFVGIPAAVDLIDAADCGIASVGYASLAWTPNADPVGFAFYEIQRLDDHDLIWRTIRRVRDPASAGAFDFEGRLGFESQYRIRTVAAAGIQSIWTDPVSVTPIADGCGYTFTSNIANGASVAQVVGYVDVYQQRMSQRDFDFPEAAEVKRQAIYGRDMYVSFVPSNRRGDEFKRRLLVSAFAAPDVPPPGAVDTLRDLTRATDPDGNLIPYVCVRDDQGNRWFANVNVPDYVNVRVGADASFEYTTVEIGERLSAPAIADF